MTSHLRERSGSPGSLRLALRGANVRTLSVLFPALLSGCVFVPNFGPESHSISESIGNAKSEKAIRLGISNRDSVIKVLGVPYLRTEHNLAFGYVHYRNFGYWFPFSPGPCVLAGPGPAVRDESLFLEFDTSGILRRTGPNGNDGDWAGFIKHIPDVDQPPPENTFPKSPY